MKKSFLNVIAASVVLTSLFAPMTASAAGNDKVAVHVRVAGLADGKALDKWVEVGAEDVKNTSGDTIKMDKPTALGALAELAREEGVPFDLKTVSFGSYVSKVGTRAEKDINANTGWSVWVDGSQPPVAADQAEVKPGDEVVWGFYDYSQTLYPKVELSTQHPDLGKDFTVKVTADKTTYDEKFNATTTTVNVEGATLCDLNGNKIGTTGKDGVATLNSMQPGLFSFYIDQTDDKGLPLLVRTGTADVLVGSEEETYKDLESVPMAKKPIEILAARGIVVGDGQGHFEPTRPVTRGELAKMVALTDEKLQFTGSKSFADLKSVDSNLRFINTVLAKGYMSGDVAGTFRANDSVTREELAIVLDRLAGAAPANGAVTYKDAAQGGYALPYVKTAVDKGYLTTDADGSFRFQAPATRAEVASALVQVLYSDLLK